MYETSIDCPPKKKEDLIKAIKDMLPGGAKIQIKEPFMVIFNGKWVKEVSAENAVLSNIYTRMWTLMPLERLEPDILAFIYLQIQTYMLYHEHYVVNL